MNKTYYQEEFDGLRCTRLTDLAMIHYFNSLNTDNTTLTAWWARQLLYQQFPDADLIQPTEKTK